MGRVFSWLIMVAVGAIVILFALGNSHKTKLTLNPIFEYETPELPFYLFVLAAIFFGFVIGGLVAWISGGRTRRRARSTARNLQRLENESEEMQEKIERLETAVEKDEEALRDLQSDPAREDRVSGV